MSGIKSAMKYGYSSTRVKAMSSKLIKKDTFHKMISAKEAGSIAAMLLQTEYRSDIEKLGGIKAMDTLIDFALSRNLGRNASRLISIVPKDQRNIMMAIAGVWDIENMMLAIEAAGSGKSYDSVSTYIIEAEYVGPEVVKDAIAAKSVDGAIERLSRRTPYGALLKDARENYRKTHNPVEAAMTLQTGYYKKLGSVIGRLMLIDNEAASLIKRRIDMRNILTMMKAKKQGLDFSKVGDYILPNGSIGTERLEKVFKNARDVETIAENMKEFNLKQATTDYRANKNRPLLVFEIAMLNDVFAKALRTVRHSVLSFGAVVAFLYLKEIEVFTLRVLIKGKSYGLSDDEIKGMISWFK